MANALKFHTVVRGKTLPLPDLASDGLSSFEGKRVEVIVVEEEAAAALPPQQPRRFGTLAGQFVVPDDFDAPLRAPKSLLAVLATLTPLEEELPQFVDLPLGDVNV